MRLDPSALRGLVERARASAIATARDPARRWRAIAVLGVAFVFLGAVHTAFEPFFEDTSLYGFRDWDVESAYHYITVLSLTRYHELPFWHPWLCGGFPAWAFAEGASNLVSPYLPLYLALPIEIAERYEVVLQTLAALSFAYLLAGRVTRSSALRALVAVAYGLNGRWMMQISEGHMWHLQYAWLPLALYFFDVSLEQGRVRWYRWPVYAGVVLALIVYMAGIYPLPHTALALVLYATFMAGMQRTVRPLLSLAIAGVTGFGLAAPKLLPLFDLMTRFPRKIESPEAMDLGQLLAAFINPDGSMNFNPVKGLYWPWHEYGIYVGAWVTVALAIALLGPAARGRPAALRAMGLVFLVLGCGTFHEDAPWPLLHELPGFSSQHVPSRFLLPAVLLLGLTFAALVAPFVDRLVDRFRGLDAALLVPVYLVAANIVGVGVKSTSEAFIYKAPVIAEAGEFHHVANLAYKYEPDLMAFGGEELLAMFANTGVIHCYGVPPGVVPGAIAWGAPAYRGEAYVVGGGSGTSAQVTAWSPNGATVHYEGAPPDSTLVYNMNYDPSWNADGSPATNYLGAVATRLAAASGDVTFHYYPRMLNLGLFVAALTALVAFGGAGRWKRWRASVRSLVAKRA